MDDNSRRRLPAVALCALALAAALPTGVAIAGAASGDSGGSATAPTLEPAQQQDQQAPPEGERPDRSRGHDCPERDGEGGSDGQGEGAGDEQTLL